MINTLIANSNYENRSRARTRYMKDDLGDEGFLQAHGEALVPLLERSGMKIYPVPDVFPEKEPVEVFGDRIFRQKQPGLYYVAYHPVDNDVPLDALERIRDAIADVWDTEIRMALDSTLCIINLSGDEAMMVRDVIEGCTTTLFETSVYASGPQSASKVSGTPAGRCSPWLMRLGPLELWITPCPGSGSPSACRPARTTRSG